MPSTLEEVMNELKQKGIAQNVKVYRRHGARGDVYGVSFAHLNQLKKKIRVDQALAEALWETGNADARTLAAMVADPSAITSATADKWLKEIDYYVVADYFAGLIARSSQARAKIMKWVKAKDEYARQVGYSALASALKEGVELSEADCRDLLKRIEKDIHGSPNRARYAINNAVIAIGVFRPELAPEAVAAAKRIGKVEVDHGETSCQTPDAAAYIQKSLQRRR